MPYSTLTELKDLTSVLETVRDADLIEMIASHGDYVTAFRKSFEESENCITLWGDQNEILGVLGINTVFNNREAYGSPWFVSTTALEKYGFWFVRKTKFLVKFWVERYPYLMNYVDAEYKQAHKWLQLLGFDIQQHTPPLIFGGREFYQALKVNE
jgi:hypothetical protein